MNRAAGGTVGGIDFAKLYAELGVAPDCGLAAFKQAYRRRVAGLHPDRPTNGSDRDPGALVALNLGYRAAREFHRGHGRLPGAPAACTASAARTPAGDAAAHAAPRPPPHAVGPAADATRTRGLRVLTLPVLLIVVATWLWLPDHAPTPLTAAARVDTGHRNPTEGGGLAHPGMDRATVAALIGEPVARSSDDSRWIYGPSWVHFECGRLADWYSSPLRPLRIAAHAPAAVAEPPRPRRAIPCVPSVPADADRLRGES